MIVTDSNAVTTSLGSTGTSVGTANFGSGCLLSIQPFAQDAGNGVAIDALVLYSKEVALVSNDGGGGGGGSGSGFGAAVFTAAFWVDLYEKSLVLIWPADEPAEERQFRIIILACAGFLLFLFFACGCYCCCKGMCPACCYCCCGCSRCSKGAIGDGATEAGRTKNSPRSSRDMHPDLELQSVGGYDSYY